jgi:hypothetical protein
MMPRRGTNPTSGCRPVRSGPHQARLGLQGYKANEVPHLERAWLCRLPRKCRPGEKLVQADAVIIVDKNRFGHGRSTFPSAAGGPGEQ